MTRTAHVIRRLAMTLPFTPLPNYIYERSGHQSRTTPMDADRTFDGMERSVIEFQAFLQNSRARFSDLFDDPAKGQSVILTGIIQAYPQILSKLRDADRRNEQTKAEVKRLEKVG